MSLEANDGFLRELQEFLFAEELEFLGFEGFFGCLLLEKLGLKIKRNWRNSQEKWKVFSKAAFSAEICLMLGFYRFQID